MVRHITQDASPAGQAHRLAIIIHIIIYIIVGRDGRIERREGKEERVSAGLLGG